MWLLDATAPWWLLTHYPQAADTFTWLDGALIVAYILATALVVGGWTWGWLRAAAGCLREDGANGAARLAYALIPLGAVGVILGLSALTVTMLAAEGIRVPHLELLRGGLLAIGALWSAVLGWQMLRRSDPAPARRAAALTMLIVAIGGILWPWIQLFYVW